MPKVKNRKRECQHCGKEFSLDDEHSLSKYCSVKCRNQFHWNKQGAKYRNSVKGKQTMFAWRLKTEFNITIEQYKKMLQDQNCSCAICKRTEPTGYGWHVDHCHKTLKVRGLLCSKCNQGLGLFEDNLINLQEAIKYLENS
jgi:hypothetical protein